MEQIISTRLYGRGEYREKLWDGGKTREIFIYPQESSYEEQNFIFRLSQATIEGEESHFTPLPDYNRTLMVLEGEVIYLLREHEFLDCLNGNKINLMEGKPP